MAEPGQRDIHTFTLTQGTLLYPDSLTANGNLTWTLVGPNGTVDARNFIYTDGVERNGTDAVGVFVPAGAYQFIVTSNGNSTGSYQFNLQDLSQAPQLALGAPLALSLSPADGTQAYGITATAGQMLHLSATGGSNVSLRLLDSAGRLIAFAQDANAGVDTPVLGTTGTYTLLVEGYIYAGAAAQAVRCGRTWTPRPTQATSLGALVEATIATPGQRQLYTFTVGQPTSVLIDPLGFDGRFNWTLTLLDGTVVSRQFDQSYGTEGYYNYHPNPLLVLGAGSYTLSIGASQNATGTASLRIVDTSAAPVITPGVPVSGTLSPVGADNVYQLSGTQGQTLYFAALAQGGGSATWKLVDPGNNLVFDNGFQNQGVVTLPATGTYLLLLEDENNDYSPPLTYTLRRVQRRGGQPGAGHAAHDGAGARPPGPVARGQRAGRGDPVGRARHRQLGGRQHRHPGDHRRLDRPGGDHQPDHGRDHRPGLARHGRDGAGRGRQPGPHAGGGAAAGRDGRRAAAGQRGRRRHQRRWRSRMQPAAVRATTRRRSPSPPPWPRTRTWWRRR